MDMKMEAIKLRRFKEDLMQEQIKHIRVINKWLLMIGIICSLFIITHPAYAANTSGGGLPFDDWFTKIRESITGPYAFTVSIVGLVSTGATLIFGGDMNGFMRSMIFIVIVLAF